MRFVRRLLWTLFVLTLLAGAVAAAGWWWLMEEIEPTPSGPERYVRWDNSTGMISVLNRLGSEGFVKNPRAMRIYARLQKWKPSISEGTYRLRPGLTAEELYAALQRPVRQMVRLPETNWARRNANLIEKREVAPAEEYMALVESPQEFKDDVSYPLPEKSLEGYLYPDTYDLPPLFGARNTIRRQLRAFQEKAYEKLGKPKDLHRLVTIASMVELEAARDEERPMIAGVIENRLRKGMRLQIDATILYGLQEWRTLTVEDYRTAITPYNTYLHDGLPPGPICSPSLESLKGALKPAKHDYFYYVAIPDGSGRHLFSKTYEEHLANIRRRHAIALSSKEDAL